MRNGRGEQNEEHCENLGMHSPKQKEGKEFDGNQGCDYLNVKKLLKNQRY